MYLRRFETLVSETDFMPTQVDETGLPLLHRLLSASMTASAVEAVILLLKKGASPRQCSTAGVSPLEVLLPQQASMPRWTQDATRVMQLLLEAGAPVNPLIRSSTPGLFETLLGRAVQQRVLEAVTLLLNFGADPNAFHVDSPPILYAARGGILHLPMSTLLISKGADVKRTKLNGETRSSALEYAVRDRRMELVRLLLQHGANPKRQVGKSRMTALHMAARRGDTRSTSYLISHGASPRSTDRFLRTPLHLCAAGRFRGCVDVMRQLLAAGGELSAKDSTRATSLLSLVQTSIHAQWQVDLLHLMLSFGDDPSEEDNKGMCAVVHLVRHPGNHSDKTTFLRAASALMAAYHQPSTLSADTLNALFDNLPPGTERSLEALRQFRTDKCQRLK